IRDDLVTGVQTCALPIYNRAVELNRHASKPAPWPHLNFAISLIEANRLAEAEKNLREAISYDAGLPQAHYQLGRVLEMQGEHEEIGRASCRERGRRAG